MTGGLDAPWLWLILAALLAITELLAPGLFLIWLAAAAVLTAVLAFLLPIGVPFQILFFGLFAILAVLGGRRAYERRAHVTSDPLLNDRTARLIGQTVTVVEPIVGGRGRVRVGDSIWPAAGPDAAAGTQVRVQGADGNCLRVAPLAALPEP